MVTCRVLPRFTFDNHTEQTRFVHPDRETQRTPHPSIELLSFLSLAHSFAQWSSINPFLFNSLRTLSIAMGGVYPSCPPKRRLCRGSQVIRCRSRCRPVGAPLRHNGKRSPSLFSSYHYRTNSFTTRGVHTHPHPPKDAHPPVFSASLVSQMSACPGPLGEIRADGNYCSPFTDHGSLATEHCPFIITCVSRQIVGCWAVTTFRDADFFLPIRNFSHRTMYTRDTLTSPEELRTCQTKSGSKHLKMAEK